MDVRGRLAQKLKRKKRSAKAPASPRAHDRIEIPTRMWRIMHRLGIPLRIWRLPRGAGLVACGLLVLASLSYGAVKGEHLPVIISKFKEVRDAAARAAGFGIRSVTLAGSNLLGEKDILDIAGVTERSSLMFLDVDAVRSRLKGNPWIKDATVRKLYPGRLQIEIEERQAFALWQKDSKVSVISEDGTVLAPADRRFLGLAFVVGDGAESRAREFLAVLDRYPAIRDQVRASILIADRRWNLRMKNGIDVRLPETAPEQALQTLVELDRDKKILTRDIAAIDLRLPDRVTVRVSDAVAQAREEALKNKKSKRKGSDA